MCHPPPIHHPLPLTFNNEGVVLEQSAFSKKVLELSPLSIQPKNLPGGRWDQGHGVVLHDQGYHQPIIKEWQ